MKYLSTTVLFKPKKSIITHHIKNSILCSKLITKSKSNMRFTLTNAVDTICYNNNVGSDGVGYFYLASEIYSDNLKI